MTVMKKSFNSRNIIVKSKRFYSKPRIEFIKLDTEISLIMSSGQQNPTGDPEGIGQQPIHYIQKIFKFGA